MKHAAGLIFFILVLLTMCYYLHETHCCGSAPSKKRKLSYLGKPIPDNWIQALVTTQISGHGEMVEINLANGNYFWDGEFMGNLKDKQGNSLDKQKEIWPEDFSWSYEGRLFNHDHVIFAQEGYFRGVFVIRKIGQSLKMIKALACEYQRMGGIGFQLKKVERNKIVFVDEGTTASDILYQGLANSPEVAKTLYRDFFEEMLAIDGSSLGSLSSQYILDHSGGYTYNLTHLTLELDELQQYAHAEDGKKASPFQTIAKCIVENNYPEELKTNEIQQMVHNILEMWKREKLS